MAENNTANAEEKYTKEKKGLDPRIALALMVVMICCSLCIGANKAWKKNRAGVDAAYTVWQENLQQRVETAYNLLTVAGRYRGADDAAVAAVRADIKGMENDDLDISAVAAQSFLTDAQALLSALAADSVVQNDARDRMYATLMLPQALEQCSNDAARAAYNTTAQRYNDGLRSFSGLLARLTGIGWAHTLEAAVPTAADAAQ